MHTIRWKSLWLVVAAHAALIGFVIAALSRDRLSEPVMEVQQTDFGPIHDWVAQPFAFGACVPGTTVLQEEAYVSVDEGLAKPVYRCTGWARPVVWAAAAFLSVMLFAAAFMTASRFFRRGRR
jgi:hypothetical protein